MGKIHRIIPEGPDNHDALLDACLAFYPDYFRSCPSLLDVECSVQGRDHLDFSDWEKIPAAWDILREEARPIFSTMNIWRADLAPLDLGVMDKVQ